MIGRVVLAPLLVLAALICSCSGNLSSISNSENTPQIESVWAESYDINTNTSHLQGMFIANGSITVGQPFELASLFVVGGTDPRSQLLFGQLLSSADLFHAHRQLLVFHYDGSSVRQLSATEVAAPAGEEVGTITVVPALKAIYLFSFGTGGENDETPGQRLLFHYAEDGSVVGPIDVTPVFTEQRHDSVPIFSDLAYGEKTSLLYGTSYNFAATDRGQFPAFATVGSEGIPSSFTSFTDGEAGPPPSIDSCFVSGSVLPLAYTRDGAFGLFYNGGENAVTVKSVTGGVANFASRTDQFGMDCAGPVLREAALDEPHKALYTVLQTLDPQFGTSISAVLARFNFNPATGKVTPKPVQQIPIEVADHIYVPRFGSRLFVFNGARVIAYALTDNGPQNPELVPVAFPPALLFGDTPLSFF